MAKLKSSYSKNKRELEKILKYLTRINQILGLVFFGITGRMKKLLQVFAFCLLIVLTSFCAISQLGEGVVSKFEGLILKSVQFLSYVCRIPSFIVCVAAYIVHQETFDEIISKVREIDNRFKRLGQSISYRKTLRQFHFHFLEIFIKILVQNIPYFLTKGGGLMLMNWYLYSVPIYVIYFFIVQWIILNEILKLQIIALRKLVKNQKYRQFWVIEDFKQHKVTKEKNRQDFVEIAILYDELYYQQQKLAKAFGWRLACILGLLFISQTYTTFKIVRKFVNKGNFALRTNIYHVVYFVSFWEILLPSILVKIEATNFVNSLYQIIGTSRDIKLDQMVNMLLGQIRHQKIECSVLGLFVLDGTLFTGALGAHITNLVILLQSTKPE